MKHYDHKKIEKKWQKAWTKKGIYKTKEPSKAKKYYVLDMFPYPSGEGLHVGHPKGYIATDVVSRMKRMQGFNVLHPMGWDAFGLPAENYALKNKTHPESAVKKNIKRYKEQLSIIGLDYDWKREINTTDPKYYKWTQWIFLQLLKKGLAVESFEPINWCPSCQTGLANEDLENGKCERCGSVVEKRPMRQWVLKITKYADRLLQDLESLQWPDSIKESQRNWIGRSEGAEFVFKIRSIKAPARDITVFTTRADTIYGVTYVVVAPEHPLVDQVLGGIENKQEVIEYVAKARIMTEIERTDAKKDKTGVQLKGVFALNPATGQEVPVWVADYVLGGYGTGAVMAVPAHDDRDGAFAKKYNLPIKEVVIPNIIDKRNPPVIGKKVVARKNVHAIVRDPQTNKYLALHWPKFDWVTFPMGGIEDGEDVVAAAEREVKEETGFSNLKLIKVLDGQVRAEYFAKHKDQNRISYTTAVMFELVDHTQVPVAESEKEMHEVIWLDESKLNYENMTHAEIGEWNKKIKGIEAFTEEGFVINSGKFDGLTSEEARAQITRLFGKEKVIYKLKDWVFSRQRYWGEPIPVIHCDKCGVVPVPEKELPVELPKVKYYEPTGTGESPLANIKKWVEVKCPKCKNYAKRETNTMPQWAGSSWYYLRYMDPKNNKKLVDSKKEKYWSPVDLYVGGAEHATRHLIYARFWHKFLFDIGVVGLPEPFMRLQNVGLIQASDGRKMSKRYGNVINPDEIVDTYGADTLRVYEMFMGPFDQAIAWSTDNMIGARRFIERIWKLQEKVQKHAEITPEAEALLHITIAKVGQDIETLRFNTAISSLMILANEFDKQDAITVELYSTFLKLIAPFAPHVSEELWTKLKNKGSIHTSGWPEFDLSKMKRQKVTYIIQINGKVRSQFEADTDISETEAQNKALSDGVIKKYIEGKTIKKMFFVPNRLINIVVEG